MLIVDRGAWSEWYAASNCDTPCGKMLMKRDCLTVGIMCPGNDTKEEVIFRQFTFTLTLFTARPPCFERLLLELGISVSTNQIFNGSQQFHKFFVIYCRINLKLLKVNDYVDFWLIYICYFWGFKVILKIAGFSESYNTFGCFSKICRKWYVQHK